MEAKCSKCEGVNWVYVSKVQFENTFVIVHNFSTSHHVNKL